MKSTLRVSAVLLITGSLALGVNAQSSQSSAALYNLQPLSDVAVHQVPAINRAAVQLEDEMRLEVGEPPRFAIPYQVDINFVDTATWSLTSDDVAVGRLRVKAPQAVSLNLGFGEFDLPHQAKVLVHSSLDLALQMRPFTAADNDAHGELWTPVLLTDDLVIEVTLPRSQTKDLRLTLTQIGYGYRGFGDPTAAESGSCNVDVVCPEGDDWQNEIPSVGVISLGGSTFCTGFLVNNTAGDGTPFFMTADHCGVRASNAASLVVYWNFENSTCRTPGSGSSGGNGNGSLSEFSSGSTFRAGRSTSDFTLVELDDDPSAFGVTYSGWDRSGVDATSAIAIHHPNTDEKRISFEDQPTTTTSYLGNGIPGDGSHVRVTDWDLGTTEPGSSGSPLFDQNHRIIGQLHGGFASCSSQTSDWYGKFSRSWTGPNSATRLSDWLDPIGSGALTVDTLSDSASVTFRNGGSNPASYAALNLPKIGSTFLTTVDLVGTTGHNLALVIGYTSSLTVTLGGGQELLVNITDPGGEVLGLAALAGPIAGFVLAIPNDSSLSGVEVYTQAAHFGGVVPFALGNALDLVLGF
ncbi:MAG: lysyl endopeptidase [Planctomycetota bacterium]|jgi:lysyl endopeptidase